MKKPKSLRPTTIIPDRLYVDREADRQLENLIEDMGRPGYVLVARQMGKTNLLLRMKRRQEEAGNFALYFDLSTRFSSARDLFRSIVDGFLEKLNDEELAIKVKKDRDTSGLEPNVEYDRHIRWALSSCGAPKVIVILDEIDSLVGHDFSDRILSQIRSMYFARANYSVYERLTYVLSGVAEPTDLIKDKNISPFNIGEKIYLSDFSLGEVAHLLRKADLNFPVDVVECVYDWARGNPRMTWDICSALEDAALSGEIISPAMVEPLVRRLYLMRFDRPPIDHIRALAETDQQIRGALISLLYGKGAALDDSARSRLYLAGITDASFNEAPRLKNRIISEALSESWLTQVEAEQRGIVEAAAIHYRERRFRQAVDLYEQFLVSRGGVLSDLNCIQLMELGIARYSLSRFAEAIPVLQEAISAVGRSKELRETLKFYLASAHLISGDVASAVPLFNEVINFDGEFRLQAKHALSSAYLSLSIVEYADLITSLSNEVLSEVDVSGLSPLAIAELEAASHYNIAQVFLATNRKDKGRAHIRSAVECAGSAHLPGLVAVVSEFIEDRAYRRTLLIQAVQCILENEPVISDSPDAFVLKMDSLGRLLDCALELGESDLFRSLLAFTQKSCSGTAFDQILAIIRMSANRPRNRKTLDHLLHYVMNDGDIINSSSAPSRLEALRLWLSDSSEPYNTEAFYRFVKEIRGNRGSIEGEDLIFLLGRIANLLRMGNFLEAVRVIEFVREHEKFFIDRSLVFFVIFVQHEMALYKSLGDNIHEQSCAREIIELTSSSVLKLHDVPSAYEAVIPRLRALAIQVIDEAKERRGSKFGRNEYVVVRHKSTGVHETAKYKLVAGRIASGELEIIGKGGS
jgi:tetratricopeptide (TPR) repeat protein